jgi:hypothetical protein
VISKTQARRERIKLGVSILTTFGYGLLGTVTVQSLLQHNSVTWSSVVAGFAVLGVALYYVPQGEKP